MNSNNVKKLKCFFTEGTYKLTVYDPNNKQIGSGTDVIKYDFAQNYVLLTTTWKIGSFPTTVFTSKFFTDGSFTQTDTSGRDICGTWSITDCELCIQISGIDFDGNKIKGKYVVDKVKCGYNEKYYQLNEKGCCALVYCSTLRL